MTVATLMSSDFSYESGILEDPNTQAPDDLFLMTTAPEKAVDEPTLIDIEFKKGTCIIVVSASYCYPLTPPTTYSRQHFKLCCVLIE